MSSVKMTSELRQSELVFVELRQALLVWNNPETWMTLLVPNVKALVTKLGRRICHLCALAKRTSGLGRAI